MINLGIKKLLIISHVRHYSYGGNLYAYAPYAKEIDRIANLFSEILIASPCVDAFPSSDTIKFQNKNISIAPIIETGGNSLTAKFKQFLLLPLILIGLFKYMSEADAIHVRCPGNLGLLGAIFAPFFSKYIYAKYASIWSSFPGEPLTYRFQRFILGSPLWKKGIVTVYASKLNGESQRQIVPFFTSIMTQNEMDAANVAASIKRISSPVNLLYVGRLSPDKNVMTLLEVMKILRQHQREDIFLDILGDGPEAVFLKDFVVKNDLQGVVNFYGHIKSDQLAKFYEKAHLLILVSQSEGWPKAITEAMANGLVCIGTNRGLVSQILSEGRGFVVPPRSPELLAKKIEDVIDSADNFLLMSKKASLWSRNYTLDSLEVELRKLLLDRWGGLHSG